MSQFIEANKADAAIGEHVKKLEKAFGALQLATAHIAQSGPRDPEEAGAAATDYLRLFGLVSLAYLWARMAKIAAAKMPAANGDAAFYKAKLTTAQFFYDRYLARDRRLFAAIKSGKASMMAMDEMRSDERTQRPPDRAAGLPLFEQFGSEAATTGFGAAGAT